jgi:competence ComEA-like helix-hairpin-helix protein
MKPFFKKRSIEELVSRARSFFIEPAFLKFFFLLMLFVGAFSLKLSAGDPREPAFRSDAPPSKAPSVLPSSPIHPASRSKRSPSGRIAINTASLEELASLPGIGPKLAAEIDTHRHQKGPFRDARDLLAVRGIGPEKARRIAPYIYFNGSS